MAYEFKAIRRVEFSDTDMAGIMHYSNYFRFMETAEHAFFRSLGLSIVGMSDECRVTSDEKEGTQITPPVTRPSSPLGWPRVHAECDYHAPLRFEDEVEIQLLVSEKRSKSLSYIFKFRKLNVEPPIEVARGKLTVVCVTHEPSGKMTASTIPRAIADKIEVAPGELLV